MLLYLTREKDGLQTKIDGKFGQIHADFKGGCLRIEQTKLLYIDARTVPLSKRINRIDCFIRDADTDELIDVVTCVTKPRERYQIDSVYERIREWARDNNETVGVYARGCQLYVPMELRPTYSLLQEHGIEVRGIIYETEDNDE